MINLKQSSISIVTFCALIGSYHAQALSLDELKNMSLTELSDIEISIASKSPQKLSDNAAAVYVITQEDIRRSGATAIPDLLRMVPGMNVAEISANATAVSARGFHDIFSNKFLVMMDGRSLTTHLFSGVNWDAHDIVLKDIERIEIIRGPSSAVWGANAMNGVINIISKSSFDTNNTLASINLGNEESIASLSHTIEQSNDSSLRIWGKLRDHKAQTQPSGDSSNDAWHQGHLGFRSDIILNDTDSLFISGSTFKGESDQHLILIKDIIEADDSQDISGTNLLLEWERLDGSINTNVQAFFDHSQRDDARLKQRVNITDLSAQQTIFQSDLNHFSWGVNYRYITDSATAADIIKADPTLNFDLIPTNESFATGGLSFQQQYWFNDSVSLLAGVRFDHHDFTGWETQPTLRALWKVTPSFDLWGAISRASRIPSRYEKDLVVRTPILKVDPDELKAEVLTSAELGLRYRPADNISLNVAAFYNDYDNLASLERLIHIENIPGFPLPVSYNEFLLGNTIQAKSHGIEMDARWNISDDWRIKLSYSWMTVDSDNINESISSAIAFKNLPKHQLYLNSAWDIRDNIELDTTVYYVDELEESGVDAYTRFDIRVGWMPRPDVEVSLTAQNLFDSEHYEYIPSTSNYAGGVGSSEVERSFNAKVTWSF